MKWIVHTFVGASEEEEKPEFVPDTDDGLGTVSDETAVHGLPVSQSRWEVSTIIFIIIILIIIHLALLGGPTCWTRLEPGDVLVALSDRHEAEHLQRLRVAVRHELQELELQLEETFMDDQIQSAQSSRLYRHPLVSYTYIYLHLLLPEPLTEVLL